MRRSLAEFTLVELEELFRSWGEKPVHAARVLRDYYSGEWGGGGLASGPLPKGGRRRADAYPAQVVARLAEEFGPAATLAARQVSEDGTTKLLLRLQDNRTVEAVLMPDYRDDRAAGCISSQVGCAMRCDFCATTKTGFERNLTAGEIVEQFVALRAEAAAVGRKLQTIVFMGMGEPMLNFDAVVDAARRIGDNRVVGSVGVRSRSRRSASSPASTRSAQRT